MSAFTFGLGPGFGVPPIVLPTPDTATTAETFLNALQGYALPQEDVIYSPLILNTILIMFYLNQSFNNLFIEMGVAPYGGYQLTLQDNRSLETPADLIINDKVNTIVRDFMDTSGKDRIAVSLMFIDPLNPANNHANIILFCKIGGIWYAYHYEPHGPNLLLAFPQWVQTGSQCINLILQRLGINQGRIHNHNPTRIEQTIIDSIQNITEGGYCQMISALQAYLFLRYYVSGDFNPEVNTPLGTVMLTAQSPGYNQLRPNITPNNQLQIIRNFVKYMDLKIKQKLLPSGINFSISRISAIQNFYLGQKAATGRYRPLYLYYLDVVIRFITDEVKNNRVKLLAPINNDTTPITAVDLGMNPEDFSVLDNLVTPLLGMLNGGIVLTKAAKMDVYTKIRRFMTEEAARQDAAIKKATDEKTKLFGRVFKTTTTSPTSVIQGKQEKEKKIRTYIKQKGQNPKKKSGGSTKKKKKSKRRSKKRKTRKTRKY